MFGERTSTEDLKAFIWFAFLQNLVFKRFPEKHETSHLISLNTGSVGGEKGDDTGGGVCPWGSQEERRDGSAGGIWDKEVRKHAFNNWGRGQSIISKVPDNQYGRLYRLNGFSWACLLAQMVKNPPAMQETWVRSLGQEDPLEEGMATHSSVLACRILMIFVATIQLYFCIKKSVIHKI